MSCNSYMNAPTKIKNDTADMYTVLIPVFDMLNHKKKILRSVKNLFPNSDFSF